MNLTTITDQPLTRLSIAEERKIANLRGVLLQERIRGFVFDPEYVHLAPDDEYRAF
jgi:hypothetical protein